MNRLFTIAKITFFLLLTTNLFASSNEDEYGRESALPMSMIASPSILHDRGNSDTTIGPSLASPIPNAASSIPLSEDDNAVTIHASQANRSPVSLAPHTFKRLPVKNKKSDREGSVPSKDKDQVKYLGTLTTDDLIDDYKVVILEVRTIENFVSLARGKELKQLEQSARRMSRRARILNTIENVAAGLAVALPLIGATGLVVVVTTGSKCFLLGVSCVAALQTFTGFLGGKAEKAVQDMEKQVDDGIAVRRKEATLKGAELKKRGVDLDTIDIEAQIAADSEPADQKKPVAEEKEDK